MSETKQSKLDRLADTATYWLNKSERFKSIRFFALFILIHTTMFLSAVAINELINLLISLKSASTHETRTLIGYLLFISAYTTSSLIVFFIIKLITKNIFFVSKNEGSINKVNDYKEFQFRLELYCIVLIIITVGSSFITINPTAISVLIPVVTTTIGVPLGTRISPTLIGASIILSGRLKHEDTVTLILKDGEVSGKVKHITPRAVIIDEGDSTQEISNIDIKNARIKRWKELPTSLNHQAS